MKDTKITVTPIPKSILDTLPEDPDSMTTEEITKFANLVISKCMKRNGKTVDVSKLAKDKDDDELTYDPTTVYRR
jgi:hypothetical protein